MPTDGYRTVATAADALSIARDVFTVAALDDLGGWEVTAAAIEVQPELPVTGADPRAARSGKRAAAHRVAAKRSACLGKPFARTSSGRLGSPQGTAGEDPVMIAVVSRLAAR